jgi:hypothetical protein
MYQFAADVSAIQPAPDAPVVSAGSCSADPRELPSGKSAIALVEGKAGSILGVATHVVLRSFLIGSGLWFFGDRHPKLIYRAIGASLAIEAFVLTWVLLNQKAKPAASAP